MFAVWLQVGVLFENIFKKVISWCYNLPNFSMRFSDIDFQFAYATKVYPISQIVVKIVRFRCEILSCVFFSTNSHFEIWKKNSCWNFCRLRSPKVTPTYHQVFTVSFTIFCKGKTYALLNMYNISVIK